MDAAQYLRESRMEESRLTKSPETTQNRRPRCWRTRDGRKGVVTIATRYYPSMINQNGGERK